MSDEMVRVNTPEDGWRIETISETHTRWIVDVEQEGYPSPRTFRDLGTAGNKMVVLSTFLPEAYEPEAMRIYEDIVRLEGMLARERLDDETAVRELCMGDLSQLPEVTSEREQRHHSDTCPECGQHTGPGDAENDRSGGVDGE